MSRSVVERVRRRYSRVARSSGFCADASVRVHLDGPERLTTVADSSLIQEREVRRRSDKIERCTEIALKDTAEVFDIRGAA